MNPQIIPDHSLYQLTEKLASLSQPVTVKTETFQGLVKGLIDLMIAQQLRGTVWLKLPNTQQSLAEIERYHQEGLAEQIYVCTINRGLAASAPHQSAPSQQQVTSQMTSIVLEASSQLKREHFLLFLSSQLCILMIAQQLSTPGDKEVSGLLSQSPQLKLLYSFDPPVIESVLGGIKQMITITDTTPEELLSDSVLAFPLPASPSAKFLTFLLHKQIEQSEASHSSPKIVQPSTPKAKATSHIANLNEDFLKNLTREMSLPLTNMKTALRLLESMQHKREQRQRYLDLLKRECDRQSSLLTGLQELMQLNLPVERSESSVKLEDFVPGIVSVYQPIAEEKGILLGYTIPAGFPLVACPAAWLRQILRNLLHNSLKFTPSGGRVYVQASLKNEAVELIVSDTGVGIDSIDLSRLYDSFYRGRNATTDETAGVGLGLTIVQQLMQRCGGSISLTTQVGKGTIFKLLLPVALN